MNRWMVGALLMLLMGCGGEPKGSISGTLIYPGAIPSPRSSAQQPGSVEEVVAGEIIVQPREVSLQSLQQLRVDGVSFQRVRTVGDRFLLYRASGLSPAETLRLAARLEQQGLVAGAFPNRILRSFRTPNDPFYGAQWHYPLMNLPNAWAITIGSSSVTVAVVDSGITNHPDLRDKLLPGYDFVSDPANAADGDGPDSDPFVEGIDPGYHGTHVAGTVGAVTNNSLGVAGVAWAARILPVRVLGVNGGSLSDIIDGIYWAVGGRDPNFPDNRNPARIVNLSLGGGGGCPPQLNNFFRDLASAGIVLVAAAGNENQNVSNVVPASCEGVIAVGAVGPQGRRAPYSNYGTRIDVMAPGGDLSQRITFQGQSFPAGVLSTSYDDDRPGYSYAFEQGTSMAAPHVAGLAALMLSQDPSLTPAQIRDRLRSASRPLTPGECNRPSGAECGAGLVDAAQALGGAGSPPPPPPPSASPITTYAVAFYCTNTSDCFPADLNRSRVQVISAQADRVPFSLDGLEAGPYLVVGWQDLNDNREVDSGEPIGFYEDARGNPRIIQLRAGQALAGVVIRLQPAQLGASGAGATSELRAGLAALAALLSGRR